MAGVGSWECLRCGRRFGRVNQTHECAPAELRPMERWVALSFSLRRSVRHPLIVRKVLAYHGRYYHVANVRRSDDLDDELRGWLAEAYFDAEPDS